MPLKDSFDELERLLIAKSTDYEKMRALVKEMRHVHEISRMLGPAQDNLYASIARGHRRALVHLESGDIPAAMVEMAGAVSWFLRRFQGTDPLALPKAPKIAEELREARQLAERSEVLREALRHHSYDIHA